MTTDAIDQPLRVVVDVTRRDIFTVTFRLIMRARWIWALFTIPFAAGIWRISTSESGPKDWPNIVLLLVVLATFCWVLLLVAALVFAAASVLQAGSMQGVLGSHTFEIRPDGLFESTTANQTPTSWSAIRSAKRTDRYILVSVAWWMFHFIPRRAFGDDAAFDDFFAAIQERIGRRGLLP